MLFRSLRLARLLDDRSAVLVKNGKIDMKALEREALTREELTEVIHRQGFARMEQVKQCELEPNGTFYIEGFEPPDTDARHKELVEKLDALSREVAALRGQA
jgi:uncharacterized membrane protein YcaP (DUF421 family)